MQEKVWVLSLRFAIRVTLPLLYHAALVLSRKLVKCESSFVFVSDDTRYVLQCNWYKAHWPRVNTHWPTRSWLCSNFRSNSSTLWLIHIKHKLIGSAVYYWWYSRCLGWTSSAQTWNTYQKPWCTHWSVLNLWVCRLIKEILILFIIVIVIILYFCCDAGVNMCRCSLSWQKSMNLQNPEHHRQTNWSQYQ